MTKYADHTIKVNRALSLTQIGGTHDRGSHDIPQSGCPGSALAMIDAIPASVISGLSAPALAELIDAMWLACQKSKAIAMADAIQEGAVWDAQQQRMREIAA